MSIHTSLGKGSAGQKHRSVIKRYEKLQALQEKGQWDESQSVLGLPKVKMIKIKAKKEKAKAEGAGEKAVEATATPGDQKTDAAKSAPAQPKKPANTEGDKKK